MQYDESFTLQPSAHAVAAVIIDEYGRILLVQEAQPAAKELWHVPAGKLGLGETPEEAVKREVFEETGLEVELVCFLNAYVGRLKNEDIVVRLAWLARSKNDKQPSPVFKEEILECRYVSKTEFDNLYKAGKVRMHHTKLMIEDALRQFSRANSQV
jgi:8-oxo-dGTP diphosphatase